ncbi:MAG: hypothetical protein A2X94_07400 [Bdellovibrionales bacterium GWB1_55_8]|nr:MAG: hypothetical protein A2X94_07400 [Bdellovibrionales bacterium GWB1_55_8]
MSSKDWEQKVAEALDWNRFLELAEREGRSEPGRALVRSLSEPSNWASNCAAANLRQQETQEVTPLLVRDSLWGPLDGLADPEDVLERLQKGAVLEVSELAFLRKWLFVTEAWTQMPRDEISGEHLKKSIQALSDPFDILRVLDRVLTPEGDLSERASPKLGTLHHEIRGLRREIDSLLDRILKTLSAKGLLQESFTDVRDGRYVIPVRMSAQNEVNGIIYGASASRQTVFVEPAEVSPLNNRLRQRQNDLLQEVFRILSETSDRLRPYAPEIRTNVQVLAHWDAVHARARAGLHYAGKPLHVTEDRQIFLRQTAHPLLWHSLPPEQIIRNDIGFGDPVKTLLITGPNTGGKTVLLKTLGLAGICARTGFPFPATERPSLPFFDSFFADVGDAQSIEEHISSFSGHILRFKEIIERVTDQSLVLLDELNTATDPEEGAALGRAFLETVMNRGAVIVSTTHDPRLKAASVSDERILSASMEFDEGSRLPTFRLVPGTPGRSRALETAERLGIPLSVLELARQYLSREHLEFENLLTKLEHDVHEADHARRQAVHFRNEAEKLKKEWTEKTQTAVEEMLDRARHRLKRTLEQAQDEVRSAVRRVTEVKTRREVDRVRTELDSAANITASRLESALREEAPEIASALEQARTTGPMESVEREFAVGTTVRVPKWKTTGTILEISGQKAKVAMGSLQVQMAVAELEPLLKSELAQLSASRPKRGVSPDSRPPAPPSQIDLRGMRLDDAMRELEIYLDVAYRSGGPAEVTIVHGLGTGALREGTRKLLGNLPYILKFRDGGVGAGGAGATIVEFDRD